MGDNSVRLRSGPCKRTDLCVCETAMNKVLTQICPMCRKMMTEYRYYIYPSKSKNLGLMCQIARLASTSATIEAGQLRSKKPRLNMADFPSERIRNFSIIAHVDHGKSTLADRLLELTGTISTATKNEQVLDRLQVERERGITVKAQTASLVYEYNGEQYLLNLIDTPGHVDFNYEVSRSLAACQGVVLLVDANQGVQAQTVANFYLAFEEDLTIIPVLNKIDLKGAKPAEAITQMGTLFDIEPQEVLQISAKCGTGVEDVLIAVVERIPPPTADQTKPLTMLLFDSWYDRFRGAVCSIAVMDGIIRKGQRIVSAHSQKSYDVQEVGIMYPDEMSTDILYAGQVGYLYGGMKAAHEAIVGDTLYDQKEPVAVLKGFKAARPMVFAGLFPMDQSEYSLLRTALEKLTLNDSSVNVNVDSSAALGQGWRLGFLGLLHMDVFCQRLEQEYDASVIITSPNVPYKVKITGAKNIKFYHAEELTILNPCHLPDSSMVTEYQEPMVMATIIAPDVYMSDILSLIRSRRGEHRDQTYIDEKRIMFKALFPLNEIIIDFFDELKSQTSGYASFDYEDCGYRETNLTKIDIVMNDRIVDELTQIAHVSKAREVAKKMATKLKASIPAQLFDIIIQAKVNSKVLARENIKANRKDVLAKCYGGDITRKMKLLRRQAEGKKRMRMIGNIEVPKDAFINILKK